PHIAAVFINRLRIGMRLQSDPTIIYGITKGYPIGRRIKQSEIDRPTPYNTYVIAGLPPEPICNPGRDSIEAVLDPAQSRDLYFVADGTGGHVFAATPDEQAKNVAKWRKIHAQQN
ncbi:MAG TPA: endolytic transglycosylase MltG, partial [Rhizomicrobium sp.]|nr:endolytic transglycosylase MltG [Rhizomicrobium sp.]